MKPAFPSDVSSVGSAIAAKTPGATSVTENRGGLAAGEDRREKKRAHASILACALPV